MKAYRVTRPMLLPELAYIMPHTLQGIAGYFCFEKTHLFRPIINCIFCVDNIFNATTFKPCIMNII
ncbi:hypothetical protein [Mucilaginibacter sp.]|uniref:hypothetical protein n=1 Tax=Mucilaginibacter sp. TaxID=1882438 RepID=UPI00262BC0A6|nr:hypothetical protein [Mucilaginibacter sp.]MDB5029693.1 hypothetical protein [Mucilaginibacter sp.]